jgi:UDP-glucose 4-epimerase
MTIAWVIGSHGLLGSAIVRTLRRHGTPVFSPAERMAWGQEAELDRQLAASVLAFADCARSAHNWEVYWAAGVGTMGSSESDLSLETRVLDALLRLIQANPVLGARPGSLAFSSSAGAIYAGSRVDVIDETVPVAPTTPYARAKLAQEDLVRTFAHDSGQVRALLARMTTIYGPGQAMGKQQGLLAHIARCIVRNRPIQIYVPFDTIRDYIFVSDAAEAMVANLRAIDDRSRILTKIIAAEQPTTIAEIVSVFKKLARRAPRIVTSASKLGSLYSRRVQFRSVAAPEVGLPCRTTLLIGIAQVLAAERAADGRGLRASGQ